MKHRIAIQIMALGAIVMTASWGWSSNADWSIRVGDSALQPTVVVPGARPVMRTLPQNGQPDDLLVPSLRYATFSVVAMPEPRLFTVHDLVSIVVNESASSQSSASIDSSKEAEIDAAIEAFIDLGQLLELRLQPTALASGKPEIKTSLGNSFSGSGDYNRKDSMTTQIQAEVIDVKPNGNLVLEARKFIKSDKESLSIILTGVCRAGDVTAGNTIRSSQIHDLRVIKDHAGELKNATEKGLITQVLEGLFAF